MGSCCQGKRRPPTPCGQQVWQQKRKYGGCWEASQDVGKENMEAAGKLLKMLEDGKPLEEVLEAKQNL